MMNITFSDRLIEKYMVAERDVVVCVVNQSICWLTLVQSSGKIWMLLLHIPVTPSGGYLFIERRGPEDIFVFQRRGPTWTERHFDSVPSLAEARR
jgi:hypothetical protein